MSQPWGLSGPQFLAVYAGALVLSLLLALLIRRQLRRGTAKMGGPLDPYTLSALAGGAGRVAETAVHGLLSDGGLRVSRDHRISATATAGADPVQQWVLDTCRANKRTNLSRLRLAARGSAAVGAVVADAAARGLLLRPARRRAARLTALLPLTVFGVGIARLVNGLALGRPVGLLVLLLVLTVPLLLVAAAQPPRTTRAGQAVLADATSAWRSVSTAAVPAAGGAASPVDANPLVPGALTGVALLGAVAMTDATLRNSLYGVATAGSSSSSSSSGSSSSCGSAASCSSSSCSSSSCGGGGCGG